MQIRALKTFNSKQVGLVREGMIVTVPDRYATQLIKSKLAAAEASAEPKENKSLPGPEKTKGDDAGNGKRDDATPSSSPKRGERTSSEPGPESGETESSSEDQPAGGRGRRSSSPRRGLRSPRSK